MDIVLGSISFILNKKNEEIPIGATERGHRTNAKEQLFFHILNHIKDCDNIELFDISNTTPIAVPKDFWTMPYRHRKFTSPEFRTGYKK